ncbi:MAG: glycosyltransferase family 39 protein [Chloroflexota bacterium]|nr:MAG: glycosyltransferase family 39 protein [Chloroflexota bacterium]
MYRTGFSVSDKVIFLLLVCLGLIGIFIINYTTYWGVGLYGSDSFSYISVARSLSGGYGFYFPINDYGYSPLTQFPPMYSITLALFEIIGLDAVISAKYLNAFLFGFSIFLVGYLIKRTTNSMSFILFGSTLFAMSAIFAELYSLAMSEALFLPLTLLGFVFLNEYIFRKNWFHLIITSIILGISALTRYVGVVNIFTGIVVVLIINRDLKLFRRTASAFILLFISIAPILIWTLRNFLLTTSINNRGLGYHPLVFKNYLNAFHTFFMWYLPEKVVLGNEKVIVLVITSLFFLVISYAIVSNRDKLKLSIAGRNNLVQLIHPLNLIYIIYAVLYLIAIYISKTFLDPGTGMTNRIFSPLLLVSLLLLINILHNFWRSKNRLFQAITILLCVYLIFFSANKSLRALPEIHENGMGLGRKALHNSQSLKLLSELSNTMPIYNDNPYAIYFYTGHVGFRLNEFSPEKIQKREAVIAIFGPPEDYLLQERFKKNVNLLTSDRIASVYIFKLE